MKMRQSYSNRLAKLERKQPSKRLSSRELTDCQNDWEESKHSERSVLNKRTLFNGFQKMRATTNDAYAASLVNRQYTITNLDTLHTFEICTADGTCN